MKYVMLNHVNIFGVVLKVVLKHVFCEIILRDKGEINARVK